TTHTMQQHQHVDHLVYHHHLGDLLNRMKCLVYFISAQTRFGKKNTMIIVKLCSPIAMSKKKIRYITGHKLMARDRIERFKTKGTQQNALFVATQTHKEKLATEVQL
ncbi:hypothetical protein ACJX0J_017727, partial [Zea mays]